jgi:AcrR family transcriptional regulator
MVTHVGGGVIIKLFPSRKDGIILSAIEIIEDLGIQGLSTKEIAMRQGIVESALYRHFQSKDDILLAVLEYFSQFDEAVAKTVAEKKMSPVQGVVYMMKTYAEYYESYPAITAVYEAFAVFLRNPHTRQLWKDIYDNRIQCLENLLVQGQRQKVIGGTFSSRELADLIQGYFQVQIIKWRMSGYCFSLKETVLSTVGKFLA